MIKILDDDKNIVFTKKFILYEELVSVPMQVRRARNVAVVEKKHNIEKLQKFVNLILNMNFICNFDVLCCFGHI